MPRPRPLQSSGREADAYQLLTPRTPRPGLADEDGGGEYADYGHQQSEPLLASSARDHFPDHHAPPSPVQAHRNVKGAVSAGLSRIPMIGGILAALGILALFGLSIKRPDVLENALLSNSTKAAMGTSHLHSVNTSEYISYENYTEFPLTSTEYLAECATIVGPIMKPHPYWEMDHHHTGPGDVWHPDDEAVCNSTITYMLSGDVGLFADLALIAQLVELARERKRTLFIHDAGWNRGLWTDHFQDVRALLPGPEPGCAPPPPDELVACPRTARHWLVTARTAKFHFGHGFHEAYEDPYAHDLNRLKPLFRHAVWALRNALRPSARVAALLKTARAELRAALPAGAGTYVGVHVRRGDGKVHSWKYSDKYVPLGAYVNGAADAWARLVGPGAAPVWLASDAPAIVDEWATGAAGPVFSLQTSADPYLRALASPAPYVQAEFANLSAEARLNATRGALVDFALLSGAWAEADDVLPEAVVCTMSSVICDLAAVGFGWIRAFGLEHGDHADGSWDDQTRRWVEVENNGGVSPMWQPLRMF